MTNGIGRIEVRTERGKLVLQGLGKTPRGQNFIRETIDLGVKTSEDPEFKAHLATAVVKMLAHKELPL